MLVQVTQRDRGEAPEREERGRTASANPLWACRLRRRTASGRVRVGLAPWGWAASSPYKAKRTSPGFQLEGAVPRGPRVACSCPVSLCDVAAAEREQAEPERIAAAMRFRTSGGVSTAFGPGYATTACWNRRWSARARRRWATTRNQPRRAGRATKIGNRADAAAGCVPGFGTTTEPACRRPRCRRSDGNRTWTRRRSRPPDEHAPARLGISQARAVI